MVSVFHTALAPLDAGSLVTAWSLQPLALVAAAAFAAWYVRCAGSADHWPLRRWVAFGGGVLALLWTTNGWPQAYGRTLFWVFTTQILLLLLVVPVIIMAAQPLRLLGRRPRLGPLESPLVGPLVVPVVTSLLLFGPVPGWASGNAVADWTLQLAVLLLGAAIAIPLVQPDESTTALAVGAGLALGIVELLLDAIPGIVMRLYTHVASTFFDARSADLAAAIHAMRPLADQQRAGAILWAVAESLDAPFIVLIFVRWIRADARDAAAIDTVLDAEEIARGDAEPAANEPWWLSDPALRHRFRD